MIRHGLRVDVNKWGPNEKAVTSVMRAANWISSIQLCVSIFRRGAPVFLSTPCSCEASAFLLACAFDTRYHQFNNDPWKHIRSDNCGH